MDQIHLNSRIHTQVTVLPNDFIDKHMLHASGEFVKVYILLVRLESYDEEITPDLLADRLNITLKDVMRALRYWEREGVLTLSDSEQHTSTVSGAGTSALPASGNSGFAANPSSAAIGGTGIRTVPEKKSLMPADMNHSIAGTDLEQTIFMAETYLGRQLSTSDINTFLYISSQLHFSTELLEYLIEYCVSHQKMNVKYMERVAINWYRDSVDTVEKAKMQSASYTDNVFPIMKAFGLNRNPGQPELNYIRQWNNLGFSSEIIVEACNRTILSAHQASFPYADRILQSWHKEGVHSMADVKALDARHHSPSESTAGSTYVSEKKNTSQDASKNVKKNAFHNFNQREYDFDDIQSRLQDRE